MSEAFTKYLYSLETLNEMKINNNSLLGLTNSNFIGESLIGILSALSVFNHLTYREVRYLFLKKPNTVPLSSFVADASNIEGLDFEAISCLFESEKYASKSFCAYYLPEWLQNDRLLFNTYHKRIQICKECASLGKHLCIHQSKLFNTCPIHNTNLESTCLNCSSSLGRFEIEDINKKGEIYNKFICKKCGYSNLLFNRYSSIKQRKYESEVKKFLESFEHWLKELDKEYYTRDWLHLIGNTNFAPLNRRLLAQDNWLIRAIKARSSYTLTHTVMITQCTPQQLANDSLPSLYKQRDALFGELTCEGEKQLNEIKKNFNISMSQYARAYLLRPCNVILWGKNYSIWAVAYAEICDAICHRFSKRGLLEDRLFTSSWLIRQWYDEFGYEVLQRINIRDEQGLREVATVSKIWVRAFITQLFIEEIYRQTRVLVNFRKTVYSPILNRPTEPASNKILVISFKQGKKGTEIQMWQKWPKIEHFIGLYKSGFVGYTPRKNYSYRYYKELCNLFRQTNQLLKRKDYLVELESMEIVEI